MCDIKCPWLGFKPYTEEDAPFFNGRSTAINALLDIVESKTITVCYAESGIGKTSLINAGLVPIIREKKFFPIWIRFDVKNFEGKTKKEDVDDLLCNHILSVFHGAKKEFEEKNKPYKLIWDLPDEKQKVTLPDLWKALRRTPKVTVFNGFEDRDVYYKPFLILDQFEQMLYDSNSQMVIESFFGLLKALVLNDKFSDEYYRMKEEREIEEGEDSFKVLVSLRQEYIGVLDYWCMTRVLMPSLHDNRYSLQPLTTQEAREVVLPKGYNIFEDAVDQIIEIAKENNAVSSILLSVICRRLYEQTPSNDGKKVKVTDAEVEKKKETIIKDYYDDQLKKVQEKGKSLLTEEIIAQIEDVLVIDDGKEGKRSLLAIKNGRLQGIVFSEDIKLLLENNGIIRSDRIGQTTFVELIHDKVAGAVLERRKARLLQKSIENRRKANYQKFISRQNPLTPGGRRIWDNKTFSFSLDNSRGNSLQNSSNRTGSLNDFLQQIQNNDGGVEQLFFDKLFRQASDEGKISLDFKDNYIDGISVFNIETERIETQIKHKEVSFSCSKKNPFETSDGNGNRSNGPKIETDRVGTQIKIKEVTFADSKKKPFYTFDGFYGFRSEYDKETGYETKRVYICDGYTSVGIASVVFSDFKEFVFGDHKGGLPQKVIYFDSKNSPCKHIDGNYGVTIDYDDFGNEVCRCFLNKEGIIAPIFNGVCGIVSEYDNLDRVIRQYFIDEKGKRVFDNYGYHGVIYKYGDPLNKFLISETLYVDINDSLMTNPQMYCIEQLQYDDKGRVIMQSYYDKDRIEVEIKDGDYKYAKLGICYNDLDRIDNVKMYRLSSRTIKKVRYNYNRNGSIRECSYYELIHTQEGQNERKSISDDNFVHQIKYGYDNKHGLLVSQEYFDESGKPKNDRNNYSKINIEYDSMGKISEYRAYNLENMEKEPIVKILYKYFDNEACERIYETYEITESKTIGKILKRLINKSIVENTVSLKSREISNGVINTRGELTREYLDEKNEYFPGSPITVRKKYDIDGNVIEELLFDKDDINPVFDKEGVCGWQIEYDVETGEARKSLYYLNNKKVSIKYSFEEHDGLAYNVTCYFDENNKPSELGYHKKIETESLDNDNLCKQVLFFSCDNKPCNCVDGYYKQEFIDDIDNNKRIVAFFNSDLKPVKNKALGYHKREQLLTNNGIEFCRSFYDENNSLINVPEGFAKQKCKRYESFWTLFYYPFEDHDVIRFYDKHDHKVNVDFELNGNTYHAYRYIVPLTWSSFLKVETSNRKTLYRDWGIIWKYIYIIAVPLVSLSILLGYPFYVIFKKLVNIIVPKKLEKTCSVIQVVQVFDEVQKGNKSIISPAKSIGITEGCWIVKWNDWVFNKDNPHTVDEFGKAFNVHGDRRSIMFYTPVEGKFVNQDVIANNLGLRIQDVQVPEGVVYEMMRNALSLPDENNTFLRIIHSNLASRYKDNGEYDKAEEQYRKLIAILEKQGKVASHDLADAYGDLGVCLFLLDNNKEAIESLEKALMVVGDSENEIQLMAVINNHLAQVFRAEGNFKKAEYYYKENERLMQNIEDVTNDMRADRLMNIGVMLARQEKYEECLEVTLRALSLTSGENLRLLQTIYSNLGYLYKEKFEYDKAEEHYRNLIAVIKKQKKDVSRHDLADAYDDLGVCLYLLDRNDEAIEMLEHALNIVGKDDGEKQLLVAIHSHLAQVLHNDDKYKKAEQHYKKCINYLENIDGASGDVLADYLIKLGVTFARQEKYSECLNVTKRALSLVSVDNFALLQKIHSNLAFLYKKNGEFDKVEGHYREQIAILEKQGEDVSLHHLADAYDDLGIFLFQIGRNSEAIDALEHALQIIGDNEDEIYLIAAIHNHLAQIYQDSDDSENAELHKKVFDKLKEKMDNMRDNEQNEGSIEPDDTTNDEGA